MEFALTATKTEAQAGSYYDRIARFYDLTFKVNGYGRSLDQYFAAHPLPISRVAKILDAGYNSEIKVLERRLEIRPDALQPILDDVVKTDPRAKNVKPQDMIDHRYLDEMEKSGFFDKLWGIKS